MRSIETRIARLEAIKTKPRIVVVSGYSDAEHTAAIAGLVAQGAAQETTRSCAYAFRDKPPGFPVLRSERLTFPAGKHDDQVDALGLIGQVLDRMTPGTAPREPEKIRGANEITMDQVWELARFRRDADARI